MVDVKNVLFGPTSDGRVPWKKQYERVLKSPGSECKDCNLEQVVDWYFSFFLLEEITPESHNGIYAHLCNDLHAAGIWYTCTCPWFHKKFYCKHSFGYALHVKKVPVPDCCKQVPPLPAAPLNGQSYSCSIHLDAIALACAIAVASMALLLHCIRPYCVCSVCLTVSACVCACAPRYSCSY